MTMSRLRSSTSTQASSAQHQATATAELPRTMLRLVAPALALAIGLSCPVSYAADASAPGAAPAVTAAAPPDKTDGPQVKTTDIGPTFKPNPGPDVRVIPPPDKAVPGPAPLMAPAGVTALSGLVLSSDGVPLPQVLVSLGTASARTDDQGRFLLSGLKAGTAVMVMDAHETGQNGKTDYGYYEVQVTAVDSQTTVLPYTSWLPKIDHEHEVTIASPTTSEVVITNPGLPGLQFRIPAGAIITGVDHKPVTRIGLTPVPVARPPFPLPVNVNVPVYFTVQPSGATITGVDGKYVGAQIWYPNYNQDLPGARASYWRYDAFQLGWTVYGAGSVSPDGQHYVPDPGTRIYDLNSAMIDGGFTPPASGPPAPPCSPDAKCSPPCCGGDPIDIATGLWVDQNVDLSLNDVLPLVLTRTYRQGDTNVRSFGVGMTLNYETYLWSANQYQEVDLILPQGSRVHYIRTSSGTNYNDAVFTASSSPGPFFNSTITWSPSPRGWTLLRQDGMIYFFGETAPLQYMQDRYGNRITLIRSGSPSGPLTSIRLPYGRFVNFTYTSGVITQAVDNIGRTVSYTYDSSKRLQTVTDPNVGITTYTWDNTNNRITAVQRPRQNPSGPAVVTNSYDANGRVHTQTLADSTTWQFTYTLDGSGNVTETDVTDPNSNVRKVTVNSAGYWLSDKRAYGTAVEQDFTAVRGGSTPPTGCTGNTSANSPTNYLIAQTDALGRLTCWTYDSGGKTVTTTQLAGTADVVTTSYTYGVFEQLTRITDPLNHTINIGRDNVGRPTSVTDGLSHVWTIASNADGTIASITDPLSHTTTLSYDHGDLVSVTDPLSRITSLFTDGIGQPVRQADPLNNVWQWTNDPIWGAHLASDANGNTATINYNADGLIASLVDPRSTIGTPIQTQYTYDTKDRLTVQTDPLSHTDTINTYDGNDNVLTTTDRKSQGFTYTYDALNRIATATYADGHVVTYTWDKGDRLTQIQDTVSGVANTITRTYDGLDRLTEEQVVQGTTTLGTVDYTYDAANRRATMTVSGQSQVSYTWDNANRLSQIAQGSATVGMSYDNANRRTSITLPNGIVATNTYDAQSALTQISYDSSGTNVGTLTYTYDSSSRIESRGGTLFQSVLPAAVSSTSYDADNRLTQWGSTSPSYDLNGNLTSDGTNSYSWDARNRLTGIAGIASFVYDGVNRRQSITAGSTTVTTLYDGYDPVQEQSGGSVLANLLTGLGVDERFTRTEGSVTSTFLTDGVGSSVALANSSGSIQTSYAYDPFGKTSSSGSSADNPYQFAGRQNDGTGLYYFRARYYNPSWGRFISEDPIGVEGGSNLYGYVQDDPIGTTDPLGLAPPSFGQCLGGCLADHIGLSALGIGVTASGQPIPGTKPFVTPGSSAGTSVASDTFSRILPYRLPFRFWAPTTASRWGMTKVLGRVIGRWIPFVGWGLLAYDAVSIGMCTNSCMRGGC